MLEANQAKQLVKFSKNRNLAHLYIPTIRHLMVQSTESVPNRYQTESKKCYKTKVCKFYIENDVIYVSRLESIIFDMICKYVGIL